MSTEFSQETHCVGKWWRASDYTVGFGRIEPAQNATFETYDPWDAYREADANLHKGGGLLPRAYLSMVKLADAFDLRKSGGLAHLVPANFPIIADWCKEHGLMGLFFADVRQVDLYPRWSGFTPDSPTTMPTYSTHVRTPTGWVRQTEGRFSMDALSLPSDERSEGKLVPKDYWPESWRPGVITSTEKGRLKQENIGDFMHLYFPSIPETERETFVYPTPLTDKFWSSYSEDVARFLMMAEKFTGIVRTLARLKPTNQMTENEKFEFNLARQTLLHLSSQVNPAFWPNEDGTYGREWVCTSLLASFSMMVFLDIERGLLNECTNCQTLFVSSAARVKYCSDRCRRTLLQRERRGRKRGSYTGGGYKGRRN